MWITILVRYVAPVLLVIGFLSWIANGIYEAGGKAERAVWLDAQAGQEAKRQEAIKHVAEQVHLKEEANRKLIMEVINEKSARIKDQRIAATKLRDRGLWISAEACPSERDSGVRGEAANTGESGGGTYRVRLRGQDAENLSAFAEDAAAVVEQYQACRKTLKSLTRQE